MVLLILLFTSSVKLSNPLNNNFVSLNIYWKGLDNIFFISLIQFRLQNKTSNPFYIFLFLEIVLLALQKCQVQKKFSVFQLRSFS